MILMKMLKTGNHEFSRHHWDRSLDALREEAFKHQVHFLENDSVSIGGVRFLGATLWTDFDYLGRSRRSKAMREAENRLNDHQLITAGMPPVALSEIYGRKERTIPPLISRIGSHLPLTANIVWELLRCWPPAATSVVFDS